jgi:hypothetical protein
MPKWTDIAEWRGPTRNSGDGDGRPGEPEDRMVEHRGLVIHIADGSYEGTISWQLNPSAEVSSHFTISRTGRIAQLVDTDDQPWTQRAGNAYWLSVENEGWTGQPLTPEQVHANGLLLARTHQVYGAPLQLATSPTGWGLGHHSMGAESGYDWGHSQCPGEPIKRQKPAILAHAVQILNPTSRPQPGRPLAIHYL